MTVHENVLCAFYCGYKSIFFPYFQFSRASKRRCDEVIAYVGLGSAGQVAARELPVLQRKLLMMACALVSEPKFLLMDELVGGLGRPWGPLVGCALMMIVDDRLKTYAEWRTVGMGAITIFFIVIFKQGVVGMIETGWRRLSRPGAVAALLSGKKLRVD